MFSKDALWISKKFPIYGFKGAIDIGPNRANRLSGWRECSDETPGRWQGATEGTVWVFTQ